MYSPVELWQDKDGDLTEMAHHSNIPQWNYTPEDIQHQETSLQDNICQEIFPTNGTTGITFCLHEFPDGIFTFMVTYCQKAPAQEQGQSKFPGRILIQDLQALLPEVVIPQWCLSILIYKKK